MFNLTTILAVTLVAVLTISCVTVFALEKSRVKLLQAVAYTQGKNAGIEGKNDAKTRNEFKKNYIHTLEKEA